MRILTLSLLMSTGLLLTGCPEKKDAAPSTTTSAAPAAAAPSAEEEEGDGW